MTDETTEDTKAAEKAAQAKLTRWPDLRATLLDAPWTHGKLYRLDRLRQTLQGQGRVTGTREIGSGAWLFTDEEADAIRDAVRNMAEAPVKPTKGGDPTPPVPEPSGGAEAERQGAAEPDKSVRILAARPGPRKKPKPKAKAEPEEEDDDEEPTPRKRRKLPPGLWKWVAIAGAAVILLGVLRNAFKKRQPAPTQPTEPPPTPTTTLTDLSPLDYRSVVERTFSQGNDTL